MDGAYGRGGSDFDLNSFGWGQLSDDEKSEMIERARQLVEGGATLSEVTRQLADQRRCSIGAQLMGQRSGNRPQRLAHHGATRRG